MRKLTMRAAINEALRQEMRRDPNVYVIGEDVGVFGGCFGVTAGLIDEFGPKRVIDTPITESAIIGNALGAAATGLRPVAEIMFMDFVGVTMDQIYNQAAKMRYMFGGKAKIPMVIRTACGAGGSAAAQHSQSLEAWFMHVPGLKVVAPSTAYDAKGLLVSSIRDDNPVIFVEHKFIYDLEGEVPEDIYTIPLGKADVKRQGSDVTVIATMAMVHKALEAAEELSKEGISVEVIDPRTLQPLDGETIIESVKKTHKVVIVHEAVKFAGPGAEIAAMIAEEAFDYLDAPIKRVAAPFTPVPFSPVLEQEYIPSKEKIIAAVKEAIA
ncbi:pyruvate/2-oxoglutarate dehydrogenase complex, dehydrogenase component beta subunit [Acetomicrobium mobile DSM 13181]|uniref:Pyruvate/2-oxoglutarate dehydrogenase complex, dehydrogenase component beta subunit n=1 Tax=Acetomicrobium mobile (strain ATCC BAA-54 / DSM 13181 / JCM 12221 / NGA) TaxID=891968 RepID=I4BX69_ACEMN|nr:alpha-ketoacid dehydrogenase subunit beta [Acetomicrobium mobile]AFM21876.1 pyruvate/2-oxoglutarate dehydrogenase complex, dehydrogenase component beta subunit [Acetomicrobium mobile DSM 13181]